MSALYQRLHEALVRTARFDIGVAFPGYDLRRPTVGACLRLVADDVSLQSMMGSHWLRGVDDYVSVAASRPVPNGVGERRVLRVQAKSSPGRLRRRLMRRHELGPDEARARIPDSSAKTLDLPFVQMNSKSTGRRFRLYLQLSDEQSERVVGPFNGYGLSGTATIPWF